MADSRSETPKTQNSVHGENHNNQMESTIARMVNNSERREERSIRNEWIPYETLNHVALECFQKFKPPRFSGEMGEEIAER